MALIYVYKKREIKESISKWCFKLSITIKFAGGSKTLADNLDNAENESNYRITSTNKWADNTV